MTPCAGKWICGRASVHVGSLVTKRDRLRGGGFHGVGGTYAILGGHLGGNHVYVRSCEGRM